MDADYDELIKKRPPILRVAFKLLKEAMRELVMGECDEQEVADTIAMLNPQTKGYKREDDYVDIDEGMRLLGMGQNRTDFCKLMKENGIVNEKFNNVHIGLSRQKILALRHDNQDEYQRRKNNLKIKNKRKV